MVSTEVGHFPADATRHIAPWGAAWGPTQSARDEGVWGAAPFTGKPQESACRGEESTCPHRACRSEGSQVCPLLPGFYLSIKLLSS